MACISFVMLFVCFVFASDISNGLLIKGRNIDPVFAKDVPATQDIIENRLGQPEAPAIEVTLNKQCAKIGEFCINHTDCCSNSCLGYMRRCVS